MKELSVFVDESGDFGEYNHHSPYYIVTMVFHNQDINITNDVRILENELSNIGWPNHCVHAGPVIRSEEEYRNCELRERQKILMKMMTFLRHLDITYKTIFIEKKQVSDSVAATGKLSKQLAMFIKEYFELFSSYDQVKIYYDNGQIELTRILSSVFNAFLDNVEFRKVIPAEYRLFQVADLICTLTLLDMKQKNHILSKSEMLFFGDERTLKKNYLKPLLLKSL